MEEGQGKLDIQGIEEGRFYEVYKFYIFIYLIKSLCLNYENVFEYEARGFEIFYV